MLFANSSIYAIYYGVINPNGISTFISSASLYIFAPVLFPSDLQSTMATFPRLLANLPLTRSKPSLAV